MLSNRAHLATITSRPEALVIASALEHEGIAVWLDGMWHASCEPISVALGGHRLYVPRTEYDKASALVREMGLPDAPVSYHGQRRAIGRFLAVWIGPQIFFGIPAIIAGLLPLGFLWYLLIMPLQLPVDPRGRNDYYLTEINE